MGKITKQQVKRQIAKEAYFVGSILLIVYSAKIADILGISGFVETLIFAAVSVTVFMLVLGSILDKLMP